jgi:hypothetical protein
MSSEHLAVSSPCKLFVTAPRFIGINTQVEQLHMSKTKSGNILKDTENNEFYIGSVLYCSPRTNIVFFKLLQFAYKNENSTGRSGGSLASDLGFFVLHRITRHIQNKRATEQSFQAFRTIDPIIPNPQT